ncbi:MAG: hypothetical protein GPJ54_15160 [Candidatus Heimdallarchaeota archaeon]|nr:hypothetical protein [Candidatus Heimdallarchaeota archaeon]
MITRTNQLDVITMLAEYLHFTPKLKVGQFYLNKSKEQIIVMWSQNNFIDFEATKIEEILSIGLPIFRIKKNKISLYPQFINCLVDGYDNYKIKLNLLTEVSFGRSIKINNPDGICFLSNELGHKIAFGEIKNEIFHPLIDLGWYLRSGN